MLNTVEGISTLLQGSVLEGLKIRQLAIDESHEFAFEIKVPRANALGAWYLMRSYLEDTRRYPVITTGWGDDDYFSRFYFREESEFGNLQGISPEAIIAQTATANLENFLQAKRVAQAEYLEDAVEYSLAETLERFGRCPEESQIRELISSHLLSSRIDLEKWLFDWELQNFGLERVLSTTDTSYLNWFEPDEPEAVLLLLPIENGWDALAYLHWFGACTCGTTVAIAFLKQWHERYQAELVCHYGTMLQFNVGRLPETPAEAFELAWQQEALAECTTILPGVSLRDHARSLLTVNRWFLHEKP